MDQRATKPLTTDTVHLWAVDLDVGPALVSFLESSLCPDEFKRAARFRLPRDRRRFAVTRAALREVLSVYTGTTARSLRFSYSEQGKPHLEGTQSPTGVQFNVSHSEDLALIAVSLGLRVGVDVERLRPIGDLTAILDRHFHPDEAAAIYAVPPELREQAFFTSWTRKEAYLKGTGEGITVPLDSFAVTDTPGGARLLRVDASPERGATWSWMDVAPSAAFAAALAVEGEDWHLVRRHWTPNDPR